MQLPLILTELMPPLSNLDQNLAGFVYVGIKGKEKSPPPPLANHVWGERGDIAPPSHSYTTLHTDRIQSFHPRIKI
jgi:hypothetical protein